MKFQKLSFNLQSESKDKEVETKASSKIKTQQEQTKLFRRKADLKLCLKIYFTNILALFHCRPEGKILKREFDGLQ